MVRAVTGIPHPQRIIPFNSAWDFYGMQHNKLATIRISFLLRLIVVDVEPFLEIWSDVFSSEDWETRYCDWLDLVGLVY